jgi:exopolyphosphatase/pppGpp-phosphohydrolase
MVETMNNRSAGEIDIRADYAFVRSSLPDGIIITVLHIGAGETLVASGKGRQADAIMALAIGAERTSTEFFRHDPPTPLELENAIMTVEDEIARTRKVIVDGSRLLTRDSALREIALIASLPDQPVLSLSIELVEKTFDRLTAVSSGRPAAHEGLPGSAAFAATLLILREFMHHLGFTSLTISH